MTTNNRSEATRTVFGRNLAIIIGTLVAVLMIHCFRSFQHGQALFSNDGPLAVQVAEPYQVPGSFFGIWNSLSWLGSYVGNAAPNITGLKLLMLGPYGYTNFHIFVSIIILGLAACGYFHVLGLRSSACVLGGLAAALNSNFFSNAAWGLSSRPLSLAMTFLALAAVHSSFRRHAVLKLVLAGLAIGMSISEGGDNGAIFSLFVAAYAFCLSLFQAGQSSWAGKVTGGVWRVALMAVCAALLSLQTINLFVDVAVKGVVGTQQDTMSKENRWDWATQWSLPKAETLRVLIPGLYGYRMDTPEGGNYWGRVGQSAGWEPGSFKLARHSGAGEYAGVLVVLVAIWSVVQAGRRGRSAFSLPERQFVWFWTGAALAALVLGWGRYAPFYQILYALPYFSTIRNPMKFMHPFHMALMILFAMGVHGLSRCYLEKASQSATSLLAQIQGVWRKGPTFEKRWMTGSLAAVGAAGLAFIIYGASRPELTAGLIHNGFAENDAQLMARFSASEVGLFVVFLALSAGLILAVQSGWFGGARARWAVLGMAVVLVTDLARANSPWILYYNYEDRYASNPVIDLLKAKPHEHRVAVVPFDRIPQLQQLQQFYHVEWMQHHFQYYNIQALDVAQEPRVPVDKEAYLKVFASHVLEYWRLTNTRYLLGLAGNFSEQLNQLLGKGQLPFQPRMLFTIQASASGHYEITVNDTGPFALIEVTNTLPRVQLYSQWEISTNHQATLDRLVAADFDPAQTVLVGEEIGAGPAAASAPPPGRAEITAYTARHVSIQTQAQSPSVLLLNDRFHPGWEALVDGAPTPVFRANFIMRGIQVPAGQHQITFRFRPELTTFYVTLASVLIGLTFCVALFVLERRGLASASAATRPLQKTAAS